MFTREKLATEFCEQCNVADDDPNRDKIICAFCAGYEINKRVTEVEKATTVNVCKGLDVQKNSDGYWLSFSSRGTHAMINVENKFPANSITGKAILNWVIEMLDT